MKRNLITMAMAVVAILSLAVFSSCSKDDDNKSNSSSGPYTSKIYVITAASLKGLVNITATVTLDGQTKTYDVLKEGTLTSDKNVKEALEAAYNQFGSDLATYALPVASFKTSGKLSIKYSLIDGVSYDKSDYDVLAGFYFATTPNKGSVIVGNEVYGQKNMGTLLLNAFMTSCTKGCSDLDLLKKY